LWPVRLKDNHSLVAVIGPIDPLRAFRALRSAGSRITQTARPDHMTLNQRSLRSYSALMSHAFLHAAVAPSRGIRGGDVDQHAGRAIALAAALGLPPTPYLADAEVQRFSEFDASGGQIRSLVVTRSGLLEMLWALEQLPTEDGSWAVRAVDACTQLARFARLVAGEDYGRILGSTPLSRRLHSRVDWALGVLPTTAGPNGMRGWRDILVVGDQPERASGQVYGFMPPTGYGADSLFGQRRSLKPKVILEVMLDEWLRANGYLYFGPAVERTVDKALRDS
jgi:hypothetical protein